jgi:endonuclease/exonuclease/phosphatase family metal-dependent hydrolase
MTYNVLRAAMDGRELPGGTAAPWSERRPKVAALIHRVMPDVVAVQEAGSLLHHTQRRQVSSLVRELGGDYRLAYTEVPPAEPDSNHLGVYVLYLRKAWRAVGDGWHYWLGHGRVAAYQRLQHRATGARMLLTSVHLSHGDGPAWDRVRREETERLIRRTRRYSAAHSHLPIVCAGDFNSYYASNRTDGPGRAMRARHFADGFEAAQSLVRWQYNSNNQYERLPPAQSRSVDHVFAAPGVGLRSWNEKLRLRDGKFVGTIPSDHNPVITKIVLPY